MIIQKQDKILRICNLQFFMKNEGCLAEIYKRILILKSMLSQEICVSIFFQHVIEHYVSEMLIKKKQYYNNDITIKRFFLLFLNQILCLDSFFV